MKIEEIVKTMMQGGFDSAMGGHYDKTEEENKKHQEKVYDMVVSGGVKAIQSLLNEAKGTAKAEQLDEIRRINRMEKLKPNDEYDNKKCQECLARKGDRVGYYYDDKDEYWKRATEAKAIQSLLNEQLEGFEEMLKKSKKLLKKSKAIAKSKKDEVLEEYFEGRIDQIDADLINLKELKNEGKEDK